MKCPLFFVAVSFMFTSCAHGAREKPAGISSDESMEDQLYEGQVIEAEVVEVTRGGVHLSWKGHPGFIQVTELSWDRSVKDPRDILVAGQKCRVLVTHITASQFSASIKRLFPNRNPWRNPDRYRVGTTHNGMVINVVSFGAFIRLNAGAEGIVRGQGEHGLEVGDKVRVVVTDVDPEMQQIELQLLERIGKGD